MQFYKILITLSCLLIIKSATSQIVVMGDSTKLSQLTLNECGKPDTFSAFVRVASGSLTGTVTLTDTFLSQFVVTGYVSSSAVLSASGIGTNLITLTLDASVLNSAGLGGTYIKYLVRSKCGANGISSAKHGLFLRATGNPFSLSKQGQDFVSANKAATLILEARNTVNIPSALLGNTYTRKWRVRNTGTNSQIDTLWFRIVYQPGLIFQNMKVNGVSVTPTAQNLDTIWYKIIQSLRNQSLFSADSVFIEETYLISSCPPGSTSSKVSAFWGCYNNAICNESFRTPSSSVPPTTPTVQYMGGWWFTGTDTRNVKGGRFSTCAGNKPTFQAFIRNTSTTQASNVKVHVTSCENWRFPAQYDLNGFIASNQLGRANNAVDTATIRYKIGNNGVWKKIPRQLFLATDTGIRNNGPGTCGNPNGWPNITFVTVPISGLLNPGDSLFIEWQQYTKCCSDCGSYHVNEGTVRFDYSNACQTANFYTDAQRITWEFDGSTFTPLPPTYFPPATNGYIKGNLYWNDNYDPDSDAPLGAYTDDSMRFTITLPTGFVFDNNPSDVLLYNTSLSSSANPGSVSYIGNVVTVTFSRRGLPVTISAQYELWLRVRLDCSIPGAVSGPVSIPVNAYRIENDCSCIMQPICSNMLAESGCPGPCPNGGASMNAFSNNRKNLGLPDLNSDGWPNGSTYDPNFVKMRTFTWMDTMEVKMKGTISVSALNPNFQYVYFEQDFNQILNTNNTSFTWRFKSASVQIYDISTGTVYSGSVSPTAIIGTTDQVRYDFSSIVPVGFNYEQNDSIKLNAIWVLDPYVKGSNYVSNATNFITNSLYASRVANPTSLQQFSCGSISGAYETFNVGIFAHGGFSASGCQWTFNFTNYVSSGGYETGDYFRYEVRRFCNVDTQYLIVPSYFKPDLSRNITFNITRDPGNPGPAANYSGTIPWSKLIIINDTLYKLPTGYLFTSGGGLAENSDDGSNHQFSIPFNPSCNTPIGSFLPYHTSKYKALNGTNYNWLPQGPANPQPASAFIYRNQGNWNASQQGITNFSTSPNLQLVPLNPNQQLTSDTGVWDLRVDNLSNVNPSFFTFINFLNSSGTITPIELRRLPTNTLITPVNGIYQIGTINSGTSVTYRLKAVTLNCTQDSVIVRLGQDCGGYPASITNYTCVPRTGVLRATPLNPLVQSDLITTPPNPFTLCDTLNWVVSISNRQLAAAYDINLDVQFPNGGAGAIILPSFGYKYPFNVASYSKITPINLGGGVYRFKISDSISAIKNNGLLPIGQAPLNELYVNVRAVTNCSYTSGSSVRFIVNSKKACGQALTPDAEFSPINISGAPAAKLLLGGSVEAPIATCDQNVSVRISVRNFEAAATTSSDKVYVTLPSAVNYVAGSINFTRNPFTPVAPVVTSVGGRVQLSWNMAGIPSGDSSVFTILVNSPSNITCPAPNQILVTTKSAFTATCGAGTCNSEVQNWEDAKNMPISKPNIVFSSGNVIIRQDTTIGNFSFRDTIIGQNLLFLNAGNDTANLVVLHFFHDANGNKIKDVGENVWIIDSLKNVLPSSSKLLNFVKSFAHNTVPDSLRLYINSPCNCNQTAFVVSPAFSFTPLLLNGFPFSVSMKNNNTVQLNWENLFGNAVNNFTIERRYPNQQQFSSIGSLAFNENNNFYTYFDNAIDTKLSFVFYRIKAQDNHQNLAYSEIKVVNFSKSKNANIIVWPSPTNSMLYIDIPNIENGSIKLITATGKLVYNNTNVLPQNSIDVNHLANGVYYVVITQNGLQKMVKVLIEK